MPSTGRLDSFSLPGHLRIETGVGLGSVISPFYDPMIAKIVAHGSSREAARIALADGCAAIQVRPVRTNAEFMTKTLRALDFAKAKLDTSFIERHLEQLIAHEVPDHRLLSAGAAMLLAHPDKALMNQAMLSGMGQHEWVASASTVWNPLFGFRLNGQPNRVVRLQVDDAVMAIDLGFSAPVEPEYYNVEGEGIWVQNDRGSISHFFTLPVSKAGDSAGTTASGTILSPMPGRIIAVSVTTGDSVTKGQKLVTLEAMKMEHSLIAPFDGTIAELNASEGGQVSEGTLLVRIDPVA